MKKLMTLILVLVMLSCSSCRQSEPDLASQPTSSTVWNVDRLKSIGGHVTAVLGSPTVIEIGKGKAVQFDGVKDGLVVDALPLAGAKQFTLEVVFRPDSDGPAEQRFLHLQQDGTESRILIETRVQGDKWYLDTYIHSPRGNLALFDPNNTHPTEKWYNAALIYDRKTMRHYVNSVEEMSGNLALTPLGHGKTSIGVRMNRVFWYKGAIRKVRFTPRVLQPQEFLQP
jgi:hypothetical protein